MRQGQDIVAQFPGALIIHQKIRGHSAPAHLHDHHEVFIPLQGEIRIQTGVETLLGGTGRMIYLPPRAEHSFKSSRSSQGERLILLIEPSAWTGWGGTTHLPTILHASQLSKEILFHLLLHPKTRAGQALFETLVQTLSEMLEANRSGAGLEGIRHLGGKSKDPRVRKAVSTLESRLSDPLSAEELAKQAGMSVRTLNRLFLTELGTTPKQLLTALRIERSKTLLRKPKASVTEVALEVGYGSVSQFIANFRTLTGQLPSEWKA